MLPAGHFERRGAAAEIAEDQPGARLGRLLEDQERIVQPEESGLHRLDLEEHHGEHDLQRQADRDRPPRHLPALFAQRPGGGNEACYSGERVNRIGHRWTRP